MSTDSPDASEPTPKLREVRYRHSPSFVDVLTDANCSLLVSTYQAGKLGSIGVAEGRLHFSFHNFDQAMGVAVSSRRVAVGAKGQIWFLDNNRQIAPSLSPAGTFADCYLARRAHVTGGIHCHELAWDSQGELWVVNTLFSCLATLHGEFSFVPRWRPPFIRDLAGEDRCHLNGLAMDGGRPRFVTVMSETNEPAGWRANKETTGCILDVASGAAVTRGLAMPHSPRWKHGRLWVLNSGYGTLETVDLASGRRDAVAPMPGYTRGLSFAGHYAFVGLSRIRETAVFGGVPIAANRESLKCGVGVVDLRSGQPVASLEFETGVEEIFDVQVVPGAICTALRGPRPDQDDVQDVWIVPRPDQTERIVAESRDGSFQTGPAPGPSAAWQPAAAADPTRASDAQVREWVGQALALQRERRVPEAVVLLQQATVARPQAAEIWNHLGNALQDSGRQEQALDCYRKAAEADPRFGPGLQNLGYVLVAQGFTDEGKRWLTEAQRVQPTDVNHMLIASALPVVYDSADDVRQRRARMVEDVARLVAEGVTVDATKALAPTNFFAAYQGENDRDLHANFGRIYRGVDETAGPGGIAAQASGRRPRGPEGKDRLRVGFLSAYFRDHTIGRLNIGRFERLPRDRFEAVLLAVGRHNDPLAERFRRAADGQATLTRDVASARRTVAGQDLDLLFFADVGMDALSYTLAFSRMAPRQMATWGHPVTTGSPHMDCFLSSQLLETPDAAGHYTEQLLLPPSLCTYYERPQLEGARKPRGYFELREDATLYLCPQTLFKFHPDLDEILATILRGDPRGELGLIEGRTANWTRQLRERFARTMPDVAGRIRWLPALPNADFLHLLASADVMLDTIHFGGGNTTYEALAVGTPVVTLPGPYLRSRITRALYAKMEFTDLVCDSPQAYCETALRLGRDRNYREEVRRRLADSAPRLFEDLREVEDFADCLATTALT